MKEKNVRSKRKNPKGYKKEGRKEERSKKGKDVTEKRRGKKEK
jgi:hypothetical protein